MHTKASSYALLAELLAALEADGAQPGTDQHLRIQELLRSLPPDLKPEDLGTLLAPVLCKNKEEQERFYTLFDRSWKQVLAVEAEQRQEELLRAVAVKPPTQRRWWLWMALAVLGVAGLLVVLYFLFFSSGQQTVEPESVDLIRSIDVGQTLDLACFDTAYPGQIIDRFELVDKMGDQWTSKSLADKSRSFEVSVADKTRRFDAMLKPENNDSTFVRWLIDTAKHCLSCEGIRPGEGKAILRIGLANGKLHQTTVTIQVRDTAQIVLPPPVVNDSLYTERPLPNERQLAALLPPQSTAWQQFFKKYEWPAKALFILLIGLLFGLLARWIENKRRKLVAEHQPNSKAPYSWNIRLDAEPDMALSERFFTLLNQMRQREQDELRRLNMPKTVRATIANAGMPSFQYSQRTRPAEYLLLLDRQGARNHRAQLFNLMYKSFQRQEVIIARYYFDGDPRLCWNETSPAGVSLRELQYRYPQARLLLLGDGYSLLNPQSGQLAKWTQLFAGWKDRALLSPQPLQDWGRRERALQEQFLLMPAAISGLLATIQTFDHEDNLAPEIKPKLFPDAAWETIQLLPEGLIPTLEHYFKNPHSNPTSNSKLQTSNSKLQTSNSQTSNSQTSNLVSWIAACAVYPELHFDLTLHLGQLLSTDEAPLLSLENITELCRLPWFVTGEMPEEARKTLLSWLGENQPDTLLRIRQALHHLMAQNPPPRDSSAYDAYAMNMALNEWLISKDKRKKQELEKEIAARLAAGQQADFTVLKVLDRPRSPLDFIVPETWKKHLYLKGSPLLGAKPWVWLLPLWLAISGILLGWRPQTVPCQGESANYQEMDWCLETGEELVQFWEYQALALLTSGDSLGADSLTKRILLTGWKNWRLQGGELANTLNLRRLNTGDSVALYPGGFREVPFDAVRKYYHALNLVKQQLPLPEGSAPWVDSVASLQNLATAYFNKGVQAYEAQKNLATQAEVPTDQPGETACMFFEKAQLLNAMLPDTAQLWYVREAEKACPAFGPPPDIDPNTPPPPPDIVLRGQILDAENKAPLAADLRSKIKVSVKGLPFGYMVDNSRFQVEIPGGWSSTAVLTIAAPGYIQQEIRVQAADFNRKLTVLLQKEQRCYKSFRERGLERYKAGNYESALTLFKAGKLCADLPASNDLEEQIRKVQDAIAKGLEEQKSKTDQDGDGIPDAQDKCPDWPGVKEKEGCPKITLEVVVYDDILREPISNATLQIINIYSSERLALEVTRENGYFQYDIKENSRYRIIASKGGYSRDSVEFRTDGLVKISSLVVRRELYLRPLLSPSWGGNAPVVLYFDNDQPGPRKGMISSQAYQETYLSYYRRKQEYIDQYTSGLKGAEYDNAKTEVDAFFENELRGGWDQMRKLSEAMYEILLDGELLTVELRGFDSPLNSSKYSLDLASRRISSVSKFFETFDGGIFQSYIKSGQLKIVSSPYGESMAPPEVSDNPKDMRNSIYSPAACRERRVQVIQVATINAPAKRN